MRTGICLGAVLPSTGGPAVGREILARVALDCVSDVLYKPAKETLKRCNVELLEDGEYKYTATGGDVILEEGIVYLRVSDQQQLRHKKLLKNNARATRSISPTGPRRSEPSRRGRWGM